MNPEMQQSRERARLLLEECVAALPDAFRAVFVLRQIEDNSTEETAALLGIKPETVKTRLHRARAMLRRSLEGRFGVAFADLFPFDGARCERIADAVVARLRRAGTLPA
jgi:RNA polymerase sigma-70 factor (ECF subfamily)